MAKGKANIQQAKRAARILGTRAAVQSNKAGGVTVNVEGVTKTVSKNGLNSKRIALAITNAKRKSLYKNQSRSLTNG